jgi:hypothetical protein
MKRFRKATVFFGCLGLLVAPVVAQTPSDVGDAGPGVRASDAWDALEASPFDGLAITLGAAVLMPGLAGTADVDAVVRVDPFYTESEADITFLPAFAATNRLETGVEFDWWTAFMVVDLSLSPWSLTSTGAWLEFHPPVWTLLAAPRITLDGSIGWGPRWDPIGMWSHAVGGDLNGQCAWSVATLWGSLLDLTLASDVEASWTLFGGPLETDWNVTATAQSVLPVLRNTGAAVRAGVAVQISLLRAFGLAFEVDLELRAGGFYAYTLVGAGAAGIRAEFGAEWTFDTPFFD